MPASRFLVENNGSTQSNIKAAFSEAYYICKNENLGRITLVFPTKGSFSSSDIAAFLGKQATALLTKGQTVDLGEGIRLELEIPKNISTYEKYDVVIAAYLTSRDMDIVDGIRSVNSIIYLPWLEEDGKRWLSTWSPKTVGSSSWVVSKPLLPAPIEAGIVQLGRSINMSTGLSHYSDKDMAKRIFSDLRKQGHTATAEAIRQFAVNNGWEPKRAQELADFAEKYMV